MRNRLLWLLCVQFPEKRSVSVDEYKVLGDVTEGISTTRTILTTACFILVMEDSLESLRLDGLREDLRSKR